MKANLYRAALAGTGLTLLALLAGCSNYPAAGGNWSKPTHAEVAAVISRVDQQQAIAQQQPPPPPEMSGEPTDAVASR